MKASAQLSGEEELKSFENLRLPQNAAGQPAAPAPQIDFLDPVALEVGAKIYLLSTKWFKSWKRFASGEGSQTLLSFIAISGHFCICYPWIYLFCLFGGNLIDYR
jgi:hypothetical protein